MTVRKVKKASRTTKRRSVGRSEIATDLSQDCRCKCSSVCTISGPDTVPAGAPSKTYGLDVNIARNEGCKASTSECRHVSTAWVAGGQRGAAVTLTDQGRVNVKVRVAAGTQPGTFTLRATPEATCNCKGPNDITRPCEDQFDEVTINVA
jgi:hypothetical protein